MITKPDANHGKSAEVVDSKSEEAQLADSEQATYASTNNDLKGTKAYQEADVSGLHNLAMAIVATFVIAMFGKAFSDCRGSANVRLNRLHSGRWWW